MKRALYGGSFDPPHAGHYHVVLAALSQLDIDEIIILPAYRNPHKEGVHADGMRRYGWLKRLFEGMEKVVVSDFEIAQGRSVYTLESVRHFAPTYCIIGADNYPSLSTWYGYDELNARIEWVVATRDGVVVPPQVRTLIVDVALSSSGYRQSGGALGLDASVADEIHYYYKEQRMNERINAIQAILDQNKAEQIEAFDLRGSDYFADYVVIASSLGDRHTYALLDYLKKGLKPQEQFLGVEESGDWIAVDLGDILIHILTPQYREKYNLEAFLGEIAARKKS